MMMETTKKDSKMQNYGAVIKGRFIYAERQDGREFMGQIESVKALPKGTLVVVMSWDSQWEQNKYESFYLENLKRWEVCEDADTFDTLFNDPWPYVPSTY